MMARRGSLGVGDSGSERVSSAPSPDNSEEPLPDPILVVVLSNASW